MARTVPLSLLAALVVGSRRMMVARKSG